MGKVEKSSGNVYADLGFADADEMLVKAQLALNIGRIVKRRNLTQKEAAQIMGLSQAKVSDMLRGRFRGISEAKMIDCLTALGNDIEIRVKPIRRRKTPGTINVVFDDSLSSRVSKSEATGENLPPNLQMSVSELLSAAFASALMCDRKLHENWIQVSFRIGSKLPHSLLVASVQRIGEIDMVLRSMEQEAAAQIDDPNKIDVLAASVQETLSDLWVGSLYEVFRLLIERKLIEEDVEFSSLAHHLRLLRIPIEKHEIAADRKLSGALKLQRNPSRGLEEDIYVYAKDDKTRAHIMPMAITKRGSLTWQAVDTQTNQSHWIERRWISERVLSYWRNQY